MHYVIKYEEEYFETNSGSITWNSDKLFIILLIYMIVLLIFRMKDAPIRGDWEQAEDEDESEDKHLSPEQMGE